MWLFAINIPIGVASLAIGWRSLPQSVRSAKRLDLIAALLNVAAFGLVVIGVDTVTRTKDYAFGGVLLAAGLVCGVALVRRSLGQSRPLVPSIDLLRGQGCFGCRC